MSEWQDIASAPANRVVLVCDEQDGKPFTIAKADLRGFDQWCYAGSDEQIDFVPSYWIERDVDDNPFHLPLPTPTDRKGD